jgi:hypothetical protein
MSSRAPFIRKCPQAKYNLQYSPHLIPVFMLDRIFTNVSLDISNGVYEDPQRGNIHHLFVSRHLLRHQQIPKFRLEEFFMCEKQRVLAEVKQIGQRVLDNSNKCKRNFFSIFNNDLL